jgi:hypothetical protein
MSGKWRAQQPQVTSFHDMVEVLESISTDRQDCYPIREQLNQAGREQLEANGLVNRRLKEHKDGASPHLEDVPVNYLMLDSDKMECPDHLMNSNDEEKVKWLIAQLPQTFHSASCWYQWSSSYKYKDQGKLKIHLWYWLDRPIKTEVIKRWINKLVNRKELHEDIIDLACFNRTQPLYTAHPRFNECVKSFLSGDLVQVRQNTILGAHDAVTLPDEAYLDEMELVEVKQRTRRKQTLKPQPTHLKWDGDSSGFRDEATKERCLKESKQLSIQNKGRYLSVYKLACVFGSRCELKMMSEKTASQLLWDAAYKCGLVAKEGHSRIETQINNGLTEGRFFARKDQDEYHPSTVDEVTAETISAINRGIHQASDDSLTLIKIETGAGKTYQALKKSCELNSLGRTIIFAVDTDRALNQAREQIRHIDHELKPLLKRGELKHCAFYMSQDDHLRKELECIKAERSVTRLCHKINGGRKCPFFDSCALRQGERETLEGRLILTSHAKLPHIKDIPDDALLIIDESPNLSDSDNIRLSELDAMWWPKTTDTPSAYWRDEYRESLGLFAKGLSRYLKLIAPSIDDLGEPKVLSKDLLLSQFKDAERAEVLAHQITAMIEDKVETPALSEKAETEALKMAFQGYIDEGYEAELVTRKAISTLGYLAEVITQDRADISLSCDPDGEVIIQRRYVVEMPVLPTIILDATPPVETWRAYATRRAKSVELITAEIRPIQRLGVHIKASVFQSPNMFNEGKLSTRFKRRAPRVLKLVQDALKDVAKGSTILVAGSLKFRRMVDATLNGEETEFTGSPLHQILSQYQVKTGHTGKDHRGSNSYKDVSCIIIFGAQRKHYGEHKANLRFLSGESYTDDEINKLIYEDEQGTHTQWFGRARALRRPQDNIKYVLVGGYQAPQLRGVSWTVQDVIGRETQTETQSVEQIVKQQLSMGGQISYSSIKELGVTQKVARGIIERIKKDHHLIEALTHKTTRGRRAKVWRLGWNHSLEGKSQQYQTVVNSALTGTETVSYTHLTLPTILRV